MILNSLSSRSSVGTRTSQLLVQIQMKSWQEKYKKLEQLGQGSSGLIFKVLSRETDLVSAAKIISAHADQSQLRAIQLEVNIMTTCHHPNIIKCHGVEVFQDEVWILMDYCSQGSLADIMNRRKQAFREAEIAEILRQVLKGLQFLHQKGIVHRDIKASNLLMQNGVVKIADFGVSLQSQTNHSETKLSRIGSPFWMSPEILSSSLYTTKADIWALGITAIELAESVPPYSHQHPFRAIYSIQTHPPQGLQKPEMWSTQFNSFVRQCLNVDFKSRPSVSQLLRHPFVSNRVNFSPEESMTQSLSLNQSRSHENTLILHEQLPRSVWQKGQFPQTESRNFQKSPDCEDTVVINDNVESNLLFFSEMKESLQAQMLRSGQRGENSYKEKQNMISNEQINHSVNAKQLKVKELYRMMEEEVALVRKRYMTRIREIYLPSSSARESKDWNSPVKKLKDKGSGLLGSVQARLSADFLRKML